MFDLTSSKLLLVGLVALLVVGPKDLPMLLRTVGKYIGMIKKQAAEFRQQFDEAMRDSELAELKKDVENLGREAEDTLRDAGRAANEQMDAAANGEEKKAPELVGAGPQLDGDGFPVDLVTPPVIEPANPAAAAAAAAAADAPALVKSGA